MVLTSVVSFSADSELSIFSIMVVGFSVVLNSSAGCDESLVCLGFFATKFRIAELFVTNGLIVVVVVVVDLVSGVSVVLVEIVLIELIIDSIMDTGFFSPLAVASIDT